jgi:hypothetical protein
MKLIDSHRTRQMVSFSCFSSYVRFLTFSFSLVNQNRVSDDAMDPYYSDDNSTISTESSTVIKDRKRVK